MKHLKRNLLSIALAAVMMLMLCSSAFAAPVIEFEYDYALFSEDFNGVASETSHAALDEALPLMHIYNKSDLSNKIVNIDESNVLEIAKAGGSRANYVRIRATKDTDGNAPEGSILDIYGENLSPILQIEASLDFCVNEKMLAFNIQLSNYLNKNEGFKAYNFIVVDEAGKVKISTVERDVVISPDKWYSLVFTMNYDSDKCVVKISERDTKKVVGDYKNIEIPSGAKDGMHGFAIDIKSGQTNYSMYVDNMKIKAPSAHVNEYASDLVKLDFEEDGEGYEVETVAGRGNVAKITSGKIGATAAATRDYYTYEKFGKYPDTIRAQVDLKRTDVTEIALYFGDTEILSMGEDGILSVDESVELNTDSDWFTLTLDMNFADGTFDVYIDDAETPVVTDALIPAKITSPEGFAVGISGENEALLVDNMIVSALAPYGSNKITGYLNDAGTFQYGYVVNNSTSEILKYNIIKAKFDKNNVFKSSTITPCTVDPNTMEIQHITPDFATDGGYYRYFMFENGTLIPMN